MLFSCSCHSYSKLYRLGNLKHVRGFNFIFADWRFNSNKALMINEFPATETKWEAQMYILFVNFNIIEAFNLVNLVNEMSSSCAPGMAILKLTKIFDDIVLAKARSWSQVSLAIFPYIEIVFFPLSSAGWSSYSKLFSHSIE